MEDNDNSEPSLEERGKAPPKSIGKSGLMEVENLEKLELAAIPEEIDFNYITDRLITCGNITNEKSDKGMHNVNVKDLAAFLNEAYQDRYTIWNLMCDSSIYDTSPLNDQVVIFDFSGLYSLRIEMIIELCRSIHLWILLKRSNIAVVHCNAQTQCCGMLVTCYLLFSRVVNTPKDALKLFCKRRTNGDSSWITRTILRYITYFDYILRSGGVVLNQSDLSLESIKISGLDGTLPFKDMYVEVYGSGKFLYSSLNKKSIFTNTKIIRVKENRADITFKISRIVGRKVVLRRDVQIFLFVQKNLRSIEGDSKSLISYCFNVGFLSPDIRELKTRDLDIHSNVIDDKDLEYMNIKLKIRKIDTPKNAEQSLYNKSTDKAIFSCMSDYNKYHCIPTNRSSLKRLADQFRQFPVQLLALALKRSGGNLDKASEFISSIENKGIVCLELKRYRDTLGKQSVKGLSSLKYPIEKGDYFPKDEISSFVEDESRYVEKLYNLNASTLEKSRALLKSVDDDQLNPDKLRDVEISKKSKRGTKMPLSWLAKSKKNNLKFMEDELDLIANEIQKIQDLDILDNKKGVISEYMNYSSSDNYSKRDNEKNKEDMQSSSAKNQGSNYSKSNDDSTNHILDLSYYGDANSTPSMSSIYMSEIVPPSLISSSRRKYDANASAENLPLTKSKSKASDPYFNNSPQSAIESRANIDFPSSSSTPTAKREEMLLKRPINNITRSRSPLNLLSNSGSNNSLVSSSPLNVLSGYQKGFQSGTYERNSKKIEPQQQTLSREQSLVSDPPVKKSQPPLYQAKKPESNNSREQLLANPYNEASKS